MSYLLTVLRHVLQHPAQTQLMERAIEWPWSSLRFPQLLDPFPAAASGPLTHGLVTPLLDQDLARLRTCAIDDDRLEPSVANTHRH